MIRVRLKIKGRFEDRLRDTIRVGVRAREIF